MIDGSVTRLAARSDTSAGRGASTRRLLMVNLPKAPVLAGFELDEFQRVYTLFPLLNRRLLDDVRPDAVIAPLIAEGFDILDVAMVLHQNGFDGTLFVLSRPLPRADLVMAEIGGLCAGLKLCLLPVG